MNKETLFKANDLDSRITFLEDHISKLSILETETSPSFRIEANLVRNGYNCSSEIDYAHLTTEQKQELSSLVKDMLIINMNKLKDELKSL